MGKFFKKLGNANWWFGNNSFYAQLTPEEFAVTDPRTGATLSWGNTSDVITNVLAESDQAKILNYALIGYGAYLLLKAIK
jgi:hypothetical protein